MELIEIVAAVLVLGVLIVLALVVRRRVLLRGGGSVDMSMRVRLAASSGRGWALGVGRYAGDELQWFRVFSLSPRPSRVLPRSTLAISERRTPSSAEAWAVQAGSVIVQCRSDRVVVELAMRLEAMPGFQSWVESAPPGFTLPGYRTS